MKEILESIFSDPYICGWLLAMIAFFIAEAATLHALVSVWFAIASIGSLIAAMCGLDFVWQLMIFIVGSAVLLIATRPLVRKIRQKKVPDPTEEYDIGKTAVVIEDINNETGLGRVKLDGSYWSARSADGGNISEGTVVTVRKIDGSKLIVAR